MRTKTKLTFPLCARICETKDESWSVNTITDPWPEANQIIQRQLEFIKADFGFTLASDREPSIVYESALVRLVIYHGGMPPDFDVLIEPKTETRYGHFSLGTWQFECLHRRDWGAVKAVAPPNNSEELQSRLDTEVTRLKEHCSEVLKGDLSEVGRLQRLEEEFRRRFTKEYQLRNRGRTFVTITTELMNQIMKEKYP
jgi:hypothetical protein